MTDAPPPPPSSHLETASDPELITLVRGGDAAAYEQLFMRHHEVALRYARRIAGSHHAEDLSNEAFTKILDLLQRGKGPDVAFRAYLLTTVRSAHVNSVRAGSREDLVPDHEATSRLPQIDDPEARFDHGAIAKAFQQLPERWQAALWLTTVEGVSHEEVGLQLGIKANAVASLTFRARTGLRDAYLAQHLLDTTDPYCRRILEMLPSQMRGTRAVRKRELVDRHLETCVRCATAAAELAEVDNQLGALLVPLALTSVAGIATFAGGGAHAASGAAVPLALGLPGTTGTAAAAGTAAPGASLGIASGLGTKAAAAAAVALIGIGVGEVFLPGSSPHPARRADPLIVLPVGIGAPRPAGRTHPQPPAKIDTYAAPAPILPAPSMLPPAFSRPVAPASPTPTTAPGTTVPSAPARTMAVGPMSSQRVRTGGATWNVVEIPVINPVRDAELVVTTDNTIKVAPVVTAVNGWVCGLPQVTPFADGLFAASRMTCAYNGKGNGEPLRLWYVVAPRSVLTATVVPPPDYPAGSLADSTARLPLT